MSEQQQPERDITKELAELQTSKEMASQGELIFYSFATGIVLVCLFLSYIYVTDDQIQVFKCPVMREMDAPVAMKKISDVDEYEAEVFIRGFVRQYVRALYPKNSSEAEGHFKFITQHSLGNQKVLYAGFLKDHVKIGQDLDNGRTTDFFPVNSLDMRISKNSLSDSWIVEIDGYMNNRTSALEDDRGVVTLRLEVVKDKSRLDGSYSGLYVSNVDILTMTDAVANNKKSVK